ncbi:hypothetical protein EVAR_26873_1 [Eumeta japonica]|uniref:Uncharacterized protein n=1 Tax=Eumeta variegata TaxID=151549 RepID=A0A4C1VZE4_EUMVA|nr:hypothetical protein EVAR_26873_1 [Eumeta japonica]
MPPLKTRRRRKSFARQSDRSPPQPVDQYTALTSQNRLQGSVLQRSDSMDSAQITTISRWRNIKSELQVTVFAPDQGQIDFDKGESETFASECTLISDSGIIIVLMIIDRHPIWIHYGNNDSTSSPRRDHFEAESTPSENRLRIASAPSPAAATRAPARPRPVCVTRPGGVRVSARHCSGISAGVRGGRDNGGALSLSRPRGTPETMAGRTGRGGGRRAPPRR